MRKIRTFRRGVAAVVAALVALGGGATALAQGAKPATAPRALRIAFQKGAINLSVLKQRGVLEKRHPDLTVTWIEFPAGPQLLERGAVDAWAIWDPYHAAAELPGTARVLATGRHLSSNNSFYLASRGFAEKHPDLITLLFDELTKNDAFSRENRNDTVARLASFAGLDVPTVTRVFERRPPSPVLPVSPSMVDDQQKVADAFHRLGLIPRPIEVAEIVWRPDTAAVGARR